MRTPGRTLVNRVIFLQFKYKATFDLNKIILLISKTFYTLPFKSNSMHKATHGGKREGAGRRPLNGKKKESVFMYIPGDELAAVGGREVAKTIGESAVSEAAKKKLKKTS